MPTTCKYHCGRIIDIYFAESQFCQNVQTKNAYHILLLNKGSLTLNIDHHIVLCAAPCMVILRDNVHFEYLSSHLLAAQSVRFHVSFLNKNITFEMIKSKEYEKQMQEFGFIPLNIFYDSPESFLHTLPLAKIEHEQMKELFLKFNQAITNQIDNRWSCRARMHLNEILELSHQVYTDFLNPDAPAFYDKKDPHIWVALLLKKIHTNYNQSISLATLANSIYINKTTVSKRFKEITGYSVTEYIINYRIKCACQSLSTTPLKICEIAEDCGFRSKAYFIKQFHAHIGITPTAYRLSKIENRISSFALLTNHDDE